MYKKFKTNILVRDNRIAKMEGEGILVNFEKLKKEEYIEALRKKVVEEANDDRENLMNARLTKGNVDDRAVVPQMTADMNGFLFADRGYISRELFCVFSLVG